MASNSCVLWLDWNKVRHINYNLPLTLKSLVLTTILIQEALERLTFYDRTIREELRDPRKSKNSQIFICDKV